MSLPNYLIIVVDDDEDDLLLFDFVFQSLHLQFTIHSVRSGIELLDYLHHLVEMNESIKPGIIFLDFNMPKMNGLETLIELKNNPNYACVPVVMLTTTSNQDTVYSSYRYGASGFLTKHFGSDEFKLKLSNTLAYWFDTVTHPLK